MAELGGRSTNSAKHVTFGMRIGACIMGELLRATRPPPFYCRVRYLEGLFFGEAFLKIAARELHALRQKHGRAAYLYKHKFVLYY